MIRSCKNLLFHFSDRFGRAALAAVGVFAVGAALTVRAADWTDANNATYTALKSIKGGGSAYIVTEITPAGTDGPKVAKFLVR